MITVEKYWDKKNLEFVVNNPQNFLFISNDFFLLIKQY